MKAQERVGIASGTLGERFAASRQYRFLTPETARAVYEEKRKEREERDLDFHFSCLERMDDAS